MEKSWPRISKFFRCDMCNKNFPAKNLWSAHMSKHRAIDQGKYVCTICNKKCTNKNVLRSHIVTHEQKQTRKTFQCQFCDKSYCIRYYISSEFGLCALMYFVCTIFFQFLQRGIETIALCEQTQRR